MSGKYTHVLKTANDEKQKASKEESNKAVKDDNMKTSSNEEMVNICIKVPKSVRKRWTLAATQADMTLKDWVMEAVRDHWDI